MAIELNGTKVKLRTFTEKDITDTYVGWLNNPSVVRYSNQRFLRHTPESCLHYFRSFKDQPNHFLTITPLVSDQAIGTMTANISLPHGTADVGILMGDTTYWGKGYGQDAWNTLIRWLAAQKYIRKITAGTLECNSGMITLLIRSGMHLEGVRKAQEIAEGKPMDINLYALFPSPLTKSL